jgi:hypothetical protein
VLRRCLELTVNLTGELMGYRTFDRRLCITGLSPVLLFDWKVIP